MGTYKVLSTVDKKSTETTVLTVPSNWEKNCILFWPPANSSRLMKNANSTPAENWGQQSCKVKYTGIPTLYEANKLSEVYRNLINADSEVRNSTKKSKRFQFKQDGIVDCDVMVEENPIEVKTESEFINFELGSASQYEEPPVPQHLQMANTFRSETMQNISFTDFNTIETRINILDRKLDLAQVKMEVEVAIINTKLDKIIGVLERTASKSFTSTKLFTPNKLNIKFPLNSPEEMLDLETKLNDNEFKNQMVEKLCAIGGTCASEDGNKLSLRLSKFLFGVELLTLYSWTGSTSHKKTTERKLPFLQLANIVELFYLVTSRADPNYSVKVNQNFFKNKCLKHSALRLSRKRQAEEREAARLLRLQGRNGVEANVNKGNNYSKM